MIVWEDVGCVEPLPGSICLSIIQLLFFNLDGTNILLPSKKGVWNVAIMSIVLTQHIC